MDNLFVIAGFARCGTTWLHARLAKHSRIRPALDFVKEVGVKEIGYFEHAHRRELNEMSGGKAWGDRVDRANRARFPHLSQRRETFAGRLAVATARGNPIHIAALRRKVDALRGFVDDYGRDDDWYRGLFAAGEGDWAIDSTPSYNRLPVAAIRHMGGIAPNVRVALILREPAARLKSVMQHNWHRDGHWHGGSPDRLVRVIEQTPNPYLDRIASFRHALRPEQIRILFFEDLIHDRGFDAAALLRWLDLPLEPAVFAATPSPNPSDTVWFDARVLAALADHGARVGAQVAAGLGTIPPEWHDAPARLRAGA